jgi:hypothetical protein
MHHLLCIRLAMRERGAETPMRDRGTEVAMRDLVSDTCICGRLPLMTNVTATPVST